MQTKKAKAKKKSPSKTTKKTADKKAELKTDDAQTALPEFARGAMERQTSSAHPHTRGSDLKSVQKLGKHGMSVETAKAAKPHTNRSQRPIVHQSG